MADCGSIHHGQKQRKEKIQRKEMEKHKLVDRAIQNIANAINMVVCVSKNEDFKAKCFKLLKVGNEDESKDAMTERLWNIASFRLDVKQHQGESQVVPNIKAIETEANEEIKKTNPCEEQSGPWFDDLAGEISIYQELYGKENYFTQSKADKTEPNTWEKDDDSSFEMLADVQWDL